MSIYVKTRSWAKKNKINHGHHFFLDEEHPVKSEWDENNCKVAKHKHIKSVDLKDDLIQMIYNPSFKNKKTNDDVALYDFLKRMSCTRKPGRPNSKNTTASGPLTEQRFSI